MVIFFFYSFPAKVFRYMNSLVSQNITTLAYNLLTQNVLNLNLDNNFEFPIYILHFDTLIRISIVVFPHSRDVRSIESH